MIGTIFGVQTSNKNFVTIVLNSLTGKYDIHYNKCIKNILAKTYYIDSGYDFGSIDPLDVVVDMYIKGLTKASGVIVKS